MTRREEYNLIFLRKIIEGEEIFSCTKIGQVDEYSYLQFLSFLNLNETIDLINELEFIENSEPFDEFPSSDGYSHFKIQLSNTDFSIGDHNGPLPLTIPIADIKQLLLEWKTFIEG